MSSSWVTMTTVMPWSFRVWKMPMISMLVRESRLPWVRRRGGPGFVHQGARDGDALLLAAGELVGV
jgi:hypothetical protein